MYFTVESVYNLHIFKILICSSSVFSVAQHNMLKLFSTQNRINPTVHIKYWYFKVDLQVKADLRII